MLPCVLRRDGLQDVHSSLQSANFRTTILIQTDDHFGSPVHLQNRTDLLLPNAIIFKKKNNKKTFVNGQHAQRCHLGSEEHLKSMSAPKHFQLCPLSDCRHTICMKQSAHHPTSFQPQRRTAFSGDFTRQMDSDRKPWEPRDCQSWLKAVCEAEGGGLQVAYMTVDSPSTLVSRNLTHCSSLLRSNTLIDYLWLPILLWNGTSESTLAVH